jgi:Tat-targeted selenate reductase subunit YnfH
MGNGWHEWPLVLFTVLGQCVAGGLIVTGMGWMAAKTMRPVSANHAEHVLSLGTNGDRFYRLHDAPGFTDARA